MRRIVCCLVIFFALSGAASAQNDSLRSGVIYGKNHAYFLSAPSGWVLDNEAGVGQGLHAVFYPAGSTWKDAETVAYSRAIALDSVKRRNIDSVIVYDKRYFREKEPGITITDKETVKMGKGDPARIIYFGYSNYEYVAYIPEKKITVMIVMTSRTKEGLERNLPKLKELIGSYLLISDNVQVKKTK